MRVLLIYPPYTFRDLYSNFMIQTKRGFGLIPGPLIPLGLLYIASILRKNNHKVFFIDGAFHNAEETVIYAKKVNPEVIGLSICSIAWEKTSGFIKRLRLELPHTKIVIGGPHPTALKEQCIIECPEVDFVCVGEGELTFLELCNELERGKNAKIKRVDGIIWKDKGKIVRNNPRKLISNLDELPFPARDLVNNSKYIPAVSQYKRLPNTIMITSRGCHYSCKFCGSSVYYREAGVPYRERSIPNVIQEIEEVISKFGIRNMIFFDETFTYNRKRVMEFCNEMIKRKIDLTWHANARVDTVDRELLTKMKKAGCWKLLYGIESAVQKNLDNVDKGISISQTREAIKITREIGIKTFGNFVLGLPGETYEDGLKTIKFACDLDLDYVKFKVMTPFPSTEIYRNKEKYGTVMPFSDMNTHKVSFIPYTMTKKELEDLFRLSYKQFYMRPSYIIKKFFEMRTLIELKHNLKAFAAFSSVDA